MRIVDDIMTPNPLTVSASDLIGGVRDMMLDTGIHCLPVVDDGGHPVGVVSSWDLIEEYAPQEAVSNAMTIRVEKVGPSTLIPEAAERMCEVFVHHLLVVDETGKVVGILSSFDLLGELF